jgi:hypothetical protein
MREDLYESFFLSCILKLVMLDGLLTETIVDKIWVATDTAATLVQIIV